MILELFNLITMKNIDIRCWIAQGKTDNFDDVMS